MRAPAWTPKIAARHRAMLRLPPSSQHGSQDAHALPSHCVPSPPASHRGALLVPRAAGMGCPRLPDGSRPHPTACGPTPPHPGAAGRRACSARCARYASVPRGSAQAPPSIQTAATAAAGRAAAVARTKPRRKAAAACGGALAGSLAPVPGCALGRVVGAPRPRPLYDSGPGAIVGLRSAQPGTLRRAGASLA